MIQINSKTNDMPNPSLDKLHKDQRAGLQPHGQGHVLPLCPGCCALPQYQCYEIFITQSDNPQISSLSVQDNLLWYLVFQHYQSLCKMYNLCHHCAT